jgi:autotransporter passenger strand-loop-strand repeat protein
MSVFVSVFVSNGQTYNVSSGQTDIDDTVDPGGTLNVLSGGRISNTLDNGYVFVSSGGTAIGTVANSNQDVDSGGTAIGTVVNFNQNVFGTAIGTVVNNGVQYVYGGTVSGTVVNNGGQESVQPGGTASGSVVNSGGQEIVGQGGITISVIVNDGGQEWVQQGGIASGTVVNVGGQEFVYGSASGTVVNNGGQESVQPGGTASATVRRQRRERDQECDAKRQSAFVGQGDVLTERVVDLPGVAPMSWVAVLQLRQRGGGAKREAHRIDPRAQFQRNPLPRGVRPNPSNERIPADIAAGRPEPVSNRNRLNFGPQRGGFGMKR